MKVAFIYTLFDSQSPAKPLGAWSEMNFGVAYLSGLLKSQGHETRLLVLGSGRRVPALRQLDAFIRSFDPEVVGFTAVASQYPFVQFLAQFLKKQWPGKFLLAGGVHATLNPESVIQDAFDAVCIGEGEYPMLELCRQLASKRIPAGIPNLWIKFQDQAVEKNPPRPFLRDLDSLPFPDYDLWSPWIQERAGSVVGLLLGRGCPYPCTYCCNHALQKIAPGPYVRKRSPENILREIAALHQRFPGKPTIHLEVESIALDKAWLFELCGQLEQFNAGLSPKVAFSCNYRIAEQPAEEAVFAAFQKANITKINIGLESGSERVRREVLKRHYTNAEFLRVTGLARRYGLKIRVYNMIGLPGETLQEHGETVALNRHCQPDDHYSGIFYPYPGTELYAVCSNRGWLPQKAQPEKERVKAFLDLPGFRRRQIQKAYHWFDYRVYRGYKPLWWIFIRMAVDRTRKWLWLRRGLQTLSRWPFLKSVRSRISQKT
jgi:radical SAM superfamily enzyme YgiQ (UPF0313 family)